MTIQECYKAIGGNYEDVLRRLHNEALIQKFTLKFLEDPSYLLLKQALKDKNYEDAFRSAHTLKGVCQNLSFDRLYEVSNELTELLRDRQTCPTMVTLEKICHGFNISLSEFFSFESNPLRNELLSDDEEELLNTYKELSVQNKKLLKAYLDGLYLTPRP